MELAHTATEKEGCLEIPVDEEKIASEVFFRLSFVEREYEGTVTNACDVVEALSKDSNRFAELEYGTSEFYSVTKALSSEPVVGNDGVELVLDRVWGIKDRQALPPNRAPAFFSARTEELINIAEAGFCPDKDIARRYVRVVDKCQTAMFKTSDELATCLVVAVDLGTDEKIFVPAEGEGLSVTGALTKSGHRVAHYFDAELNGYAWLAPYDRVVPVLFMVFRKVRSSALWIGISSPELNTTEVPVVDVVPLQDPSRVADFLQTLATNTKRLWAAEASGKVSVLMRRHVFLKTADFVCVTTAHPSFEVDFTACPRVACNWDTLYSETDLGMVLSLYTFASYVKTILEQHLGLRIEVLFPVNPSEWQLHCRIVSVEKQRTAEKAKYMSVEKMICDLAEGRLCRGYNTVQRIDTGYAPPPPSTCNPLCTRQCEVDSNGINITLYRYFVRLYPNTFNQYWFGDEPSFLPS